MITIKTRKICLRVRNAAMDRTAKLWKNRVNDYGFSLALNCPVALELHKFKGLKDAAVTTKVVRTGDYSETQLPWQVSDWIRKFDRWLMSPEDNERPEPFEIEMEVPA